MGKKSDLSDFERGTIVGARRAGCSVSRAAEALGFSRTTVSRVFREWSEKQKTSSNRRSCGRKPLVDERGRRRMQEIVQANLRATTREITSEFNSGTRRAISERTAYRTLCRMGINNRRPLSARHKDTPLQWPPPDQDQDQDHNWTGEDSAWSDGSEPEDCTAAQAPQDLSQGSPGSPRSPVCPVSQGSPGSPMCPGSRVSQGSEVSQVFVSGE